MNCPVPDEPAPPERDAHPSEPPSTAQPWLPPARSQTRPRQQRVQEVLAKAGELLDWHPGAAACTYRGGPDVQSTLTRAWREAIARLADGSIASGDTAQWLDLLDDIRSCRARLPLSALSPIRSLHVTSHAPRVRGDTT